MGDFNRRIFGYCTEQVDKAYQRMTDELSQTRTENKLLQERMKRLEYENMNLKAELAVKNEILHVAGKSK